MRCAHARIFCLLYFLYFYNIKRTFLAFVIRHNERNVLSLTMWPLGSEVGAVVW